MFVVFAYDFPHLKTSEGFCWLVAAGMVPDLVLLAPHKDIRSPAYSRPTTTPGLEAPQPRDLLTALGVRYVVTPHNSEAARRLLLDLKPRLGCILGARIIHSAIINSFSLGIVNVHPGLLPENRGPNPANNAVLRGLPQAVTAHLITDEIDRGIFVRGRFVEVHPYDSITDIDQRLTNNEFPLLVESLQTLNEEPEGFYTPISEGTYNATLTLEQEEAVARRFYSYKRRYREMLDSYVPVIEQETGVRHYPKLGSRF